MKTKIEINGYEIEIEEIDGTINVKAELDGETVEEFTLEPVSAQGEEGQGEEGQDEDSDIQSFGDFEGEEGGVEDFESEEGGSEEAEEAEEEEEESNESLKLENFQSFLNKKK